MLKQELILMRPLLQNGKDDVYKYGILRSDFKNDVLKRVYDVILSDVSDLTLQQVDEQLYKEYVSLLKELDLQEFDIYAPVPALLKELKKSQKAEHFKNLASKLQKCDSNNLDDVLSEIVRESTMYDTGSKKKTDISSIVLSSFEERSKRVKGQLIGYRTGLNKLDKMIDGVCKGRLIILGGYTSYGKSMLGVQMTANILHDKAKVLFFSLEMTQEQVANRLLSNLGQTNIENFIFSDKGNQNSEQTYDVLKKMDLEIFDSIRDFNQIINIIKSRKSQGKCDVVVIDYIQNLSTQGFKDKYTMLSQVAHQLQTISIQEDVGVIALSQVNRESVKNKSNAHGFKGAGDIEEAGDIAINIKRFKDGNNLTPEFNIVITKNRNGMTGTIECHIKPEYSSIYQIT